MKAEKTRLPFLNHWKALFTLAFFVGAMGNSIAQSPKKYYENGMYEKAFVEAVYKQNKKVKLKSKFTDIIYASYDKIYADHASYIKSTQTGWDISYSRLIRMLKFRAKVTHAGVYNNLKNILYDEIMLDYLATKFNDDNQKDLDQARLHESKDEYKQALKLYENIAKRHEQALPITTLKDRLNIIDHEEKITNAKQRIGDLLIVEAAQILGTTEKSANRAISLIKEARNYRALSAEEEELLTFANLVKGESWIKEADKLLENPTKKNARLAYDLYQRASSVRPLTAEEEQRSNDAKEIGMTRVMVKMKGEDNIHTAEEMTGILNSSKGSKWLDYYFENSNGLTMDFQVEVTESKPRVFLGKIEREVKQNTRTVEYYEDETDANGNTTKVKKTRKAIGMVAYLSRTKSAHLQWSVQVIDLAAGNAIFSESMESVIEETHQYASLVSGDALALPEDTETDVDLDSQPFSSDKEMKTQVKSNYLSELQMMIANQQFHMQNINLVIGG